MNILQDITFMGAQGVKINEVGDSGQKNLTGDITGILNILIGSLGVVAVIVIIIGGISYMSSAGDSGKVKKAKDTILYGVIGLIVCALAFAIVNFVIGGILGGGSNSGGGDGGGVSPSESEQCVQDGGRWYPDGHGGGMCEETQ